MFRCLVEDGGTIIDTRLKYALLLWDTQLVYPLHYFLYYRSTFFAIALRELRSHQIPDSVKARFKSSINPNCWAHSIK